MSGIAGIYYLDGRKVDHENLSRMSEVLAHRGPDASGLWHLGPVGLAHKMLWTTPESLHEKLPALTQDQSLVLTGEVRIDNREELIRELEFPPASKNGTLTDSQLILAAYERWGAKCCEKMLGDFAFAIWDACRQILFCARDHFGAKPFYYFRSHEMFIFASEIKALFCLSEVPRRINEMRVAEYLLPDIEFEDQEATFYKEIFRLPPGCQMSVTRSGVSMRPYWSLDSSHELTFSSDQEYEEAFREIFLKEVGSRLRSAFPVGSTLSGGLDSSSIVCVARKILSRNGKPYLHTFSGISEDMDHCPEYPFIQAVLSGGGLEPHIVRADQIDLYKEDFKHVMRNADEPIDVIHVSWVCRMMYALAQKSGIRVLLDGIEGDHALQHDLEYQLQFLRRSGDWKTLFRELTGLSKIRQLPAWRYLLSFCISTFAPGPMKNGWEALRGRGQKKSWEDSLVSPKFARRIHLQERLSKHYKYQHRRRTLRQDHEDRLKTAVLERALEVSGRAAMAFSVDLRHPFLSKRLAEFCLALPDNQKIYRGWTKTILRRSLAGYLPPEVHGRSDKPNLHGGFLSRLFASEERLSGNVLMHDLEIICDYIDLNKIDKINQCYKHHGSVDDGFTLWKSLALALWFQRVQCGSEPVSNHQRSQDDAIRKKERGDRETPRKSPQEALC